MPDRDKTKDALLCELESLKKRAAQADALQQRMQVLEKDYQSLKNSCRERTQSLERECTFRDEALEALKLAQVIIDRSPVILFRREAGGNHRLLYVSDNIIQFGYSPEDFYAGRIHFRDILHPDDFKSMQADLDDYAAKDVESYTQSYRILTKSGEVRWVEDQTSVVRDAQGHKRYNQGIVVDVTARKLAEEKLRRSEEKFRRIVETTGEGFLMMDDNLTIHYANEAYCRMLGYRPAEILGKRPYDLATEEFRHFMRVNHQRFLSMDSRKMEGSLRAKSGRSVPVLIHGNTLRDSRGRKLGNIAFVTDLTEQKKALELAGRVQRSLVPSHAPQIPGLDIAGRSDSCDEVGGDYFDFLTGPPNGRNPLKIVVGDISGHGVDAALLMTTARAFIRSRASQKQRAAHIVSSMNRDLALDLSDSGHFMTLFYIEVDPDTGSVRWVRAGHDPAVVYDPVSDRFDQLSGLGGIPLGIDASFTYNDDTRRHIAPGTVIALGTDGIWEARNPDGAFFGKERFRGVIRENAGQPAAVILDTVFAAVKTFSEGVPAEDDITLVIIKIDPAAA